MEYLGEIAFMMAALALSIGLTGLTYLHRRVNNLEKKLKEFDVIPASFDSIPKEFSSFKEFGEEPSNQNE